MRHAGKTKDVWMGRTPDWVAACRLVGMVLILSITVPLYADVRTYTLGGTEHPWETSGTLTDLDATSTPGGLQPRKLRTEENLARTIPERGGNVWTSWSVYFSLPHVYDNTDKLTDGYRTSIYRRDINPKWKTMPKGFPSIGTIFLDLGNQFGINRVRLVPPVEVAGETFPQPITVGLNDGDPEDIDGRGWPLLSSVWTGKASVQTTVDLRFPAQPARFVGVTIDATGLEALDIGELEVYGEGYVPESSYTSDIIDFGDIVNWGEIRWTGEKDEHAKILVRTRTGKDEDPNRYWRKIGGEEKESPFSESGERLTREEYERLPVSERGRITYDTQNWSFWSAPYSFEDGRRGVQITSPGPRRHFQVSIEFLSTFEHGGVLDTLGFEFARPVLAREIVGEIYPTEVCAGRTTSFTCAVRPSIDRDDSGFNELEIYSPATIHSVSAVRIDGLAASFESELTENRFAVRFPYIQIDRQLVEVDFQATVLRYGTPFSIRAFDSEGEGLPQIVIPGNALSDIESERLWVETALHTPLIASMRASPNPFTPNEDGINDRCTLSYALLRLSAPARVFVEIRDLRGEVVQTIHSGAESSALHSHIWDGRDEDQNLVPPGIYLYRIQVESDSGMEEQVETVSVAH